MKKNLLCLRCGQEMNRIDHQKLLLVPDNIIPPVHAYHLIHSAADIDIYSCSGCGKLEFFLADAKEEGLPQRRCPKCGKQHDFDYPKCPFCKYDYHG